MAPASLSFAGYRYASEGELSETATASSRSPTTNQSDAEAALRLIDALGRR